MQWFDANSIAADSLLRDGRNVLLLVRHHLAGGGLMPIVGRWSREHGTWVAIDFSPRSMHGIEPNSIPLGTPSFIAEIQMPAAQAAAA